MVKRGRLLIATSNPGKLREIRHVFADLDVELADLKEFGKLPQPLEDGLTFEENARKKALHYAGLTGLWTLADDSGLEVDALGGQPGVNSARFAGPAQDAAANNIKLIRCLGEVPPKRRSARFRCVIAIADGQRVSATAAGVFEGVIIDEPRGQNGFGYDPYFLLPELGQTVAELEPAHKNRISHRGQALQNIRPKLEALL
ncbi:MAG: RdgB/HAM1 family non-canonical purine NTP pyrophosphatase [Phycisphaerae bacterium]|nr:RdgB/HAM1 family non-canonical purine NTP pyrophosphatase [Phycisphaerae bacterium]